MKRVNIVNYRGRWRSVHCCADINPLVDAVEIRDSCGCCPDAVVSAWPYLATALDRLYSYPASFVIGDRLAGYSGIAPRANWEDQLKEININPTAIELIKRKLDEEPLIFIDDDETDEEEEE